MKKRLLAFLCCPSCGGSLRHDEFSSDRRTRETIDGMLVCSRCRKWYPIIAGIPRMLPFNMIRKDMLSAYMEKYSSHIPKGLREEAPEAARLKAKTSKSFGFQWNAFSEIFPEFEQNFLDYISPLDRPFFRGKLVLDAGCGFGRHTYFAAKYGAEVIGFDLSDAVEAAYRNCAGLRKVHIVQGDIYKPPFRKRFDFIMSIGVLHHLPDPEKGFLRLAELSRSGKPVFAWVYGREGRWFKVYVVEGVIRQLTKRTPHRALYYMCYIPASVYQLSNALYRFCEKRPALRPLGRFFPFKGYAKFPFRVKHADAFDLLATPVNNYYRREDMEKWAKDARLADVRITQLGGKSWRLFGRKRHRG